MFKGKGNGTSTSARAQAQGRAELHRQVAGRLGHWRLYVEAKLQELEERRNPAGLQDTSEAARVSAAPVERAGAAGARARRAVEELPDENNSSNTPSVELPRLDGEKA